MGNTHARSQKLRIPKCPRSGQVRSQLRLHKHFQFWVQTPQIITVAGFLRSPSPAENRLQESWALSTFFGSPFTALRFLLQFLSLFWFCLLCCRLFALFLLFQFFLLDLRFDSTGGGGGCLYIIRYLPLADLRLCLFLSKDKGLLNSSIFFNATCCSRFLRFGTPRPFPLSRLHWALEMLRLSLHLRRKSWKKTTCPGLTTETYRIQEEGLKIETCEISVLRRCCLTAASYASRSLRWTHLNLGDGCLVHVQLTHQNHPELQSSWRHWAWKANKRSTKREPGQILDVPSLIISFAFPLPPNGLAI